MKKNNTPNEMQKVMEMKDLLYRHAPELSNKDKKRMLQAVIPKQKSFFLRPYAVSFASVMALFLLFVIRPSALPYSHSQDSPTYKAKNTFQAIQDFVSPLNNQEDILDSENLPVNEQTQSGNTAPTPQEDRNAQESQTSDDSRSTPASVDGTDTPTAQQGDDTIHNSSSNHALRDACKAALDLRKRNGEQVNSDEYKACDRL